MEVGVAEVSIHVLGMAKVKENSITVGIFGVDSNNGVVMVDGV